jgi:hypothetical protein
MHETMEAAIERNRQRQAMRRRYSYPVRLPLPRYHAWEVLTDAMLYLKATRATVDPHGAHEFQSVGDYDAYVMLVGLRASLCTPR